MKTYNKRMLSDCVVPPFQWTPRSNSDEVRPAYNNQKKTRQYTNEFKVRAVKLTHLSGASVKVWPRHWTSDFPLASN